MASETELITTVSGKGHVTLPAEIRRRRQWPAGTRLVVEETNDGVLLRPEHMFPETRSDEVFGMLVRPGPPTTVEQMNEAIEEEAGRCHARDRC